MTEPRDPALDQDLLDAIALAQRAEPEDAAAIARVRSRVMQRIGQDSVRHHVAIDAAEGTWHKFLPGIARKVLHEQDGVMSYLLRFEPGAVLPAHRHPVDEECVVLEGRLRIGTLELGPGGYHHVPKDVLDADSTSDEGCVIYLRGATPKAEHLV
jgi:quercetin dioxygenase-like cupin family protein